MHYLRFALRSLLKSPLITGAAILSLALGIGANAAIFSIFERLLLKPLPVAEPGRLVNVLSPGPKPGSQSTNIAGGMDSVFSYPMFRDLQDSPAVQEVFSGLAAHRSFGANLAFEGDSLSAAGLMVSGSYFPVLGIQPVVGRLLGPDDDREFGAHPVVVLSYEYWRDRFASNPGVLEKTLVVNGRPLTIVGVAPEGFEGTSLGQNPKVFVPLTMRAALTPGWDAFEERRSYWAYLFARLKPGVTLEAAQAAINVPYGAIIRTVEVPLQQGLSEQTLERFAGKQLALEPGRRGQSELYAQVSTPMVLLLCVTGFVLLIACANLANLLLVRATNRAGEIAVRLSLGAQRRQVVAQLLTESFVLGACGALLGWAVAKGTLGLLLSLLPADRALGVSTEMGPVAWAFLGVLAVVTGLVGLFPALHTTRLDLSGALKGQAGRSSASRTANRFRAAMVTVQIALSMALLVSAGLFAKSLLNVSRVELGIQIDHLATFALSPELNNYNPAQCRTFFARVEEEVAALPGVRQVVAAQVPLIAGSNWGSDVSVEGFDAGPDTDTHSNFNAVGPGYFQTVGVPLLSGREFEPRDDAGAPKVAVVNQAFARKFGLGDQVVGKRMEVGSGGELDIEIVGLVRDAKYSAVKSEVPPLFFVPYRQSEGIGSLSFYVRAEGDPADLLPSLRATVNRIDPTLPVDELRTMTVQVRENVFLDRMLTTLSAAFAVLATVLAAIGLYGVVAYSVAQRTREIGLRMALGADARRIQRLVLRQVGWLTLFGGLLGLGAALALGRLAGSLLFGLGGHDPWVLITSALLLAAVALSAGLLPARRAARIDPMVALHNE